jgi:hypothetical protein
MDHSTWRLGRAHLGAGDGDETTVINRLNPAHVTDWYRLWFPVTDRGRLRSATLRLIVDDGAVVHLNGTEIGRINLPGGTIAADTRALAARSGAAENTWVTFSVPLHLLTEGSNLLAVEVHQVAASDADTSFDVRLQAGT